MTTTRKISGSNEEDKWHQVANDLTALTSPFQYNVVIEHRATQVALVIDMDPGGGFEGGYEFTSLVAPLPIQFTSITAPLSKGEEFRFALHDEGVFDRVGKFLHIEEDLSVGYAEFDKQLIVKTNDESRLKAIFKDASVRKVFQTLKEFTLQITHDENKKNQYQLELMIDRAIVDHKALNKIYNAFITILDEVEGQMQAH